MSGEEVNLLFFVTQNGECIACQQQPLCPITRKWCQIISVGQSEQQKRPVALVHFSGGLHHMSEGV